MVKFQRLKRTGLSTRTRFAGIALAAIATVVVGSVAVAAENLRSDPAAMATAAPVPDTSRNSRVGVPFELVDHNGNIVTDGDFRGRYTLIYFGYTFCPDICPTALSRMTEAIDLLENDGAIITPIFITLDPDRDTPDVLKSYVGFFHPRLVGLTGSPDQVDMVARAYRVFHMKMPVSGEYEPYYTIDHSSVTYMVGPDGRIVTRFWDNLSPESMAKRMLTILKDETARTTAAPISMAGGD